MKKVVCALSMLLLVSACKTTEPIYYHGTYNKAVYSYFKGDQASLTEQIEVLQQIIEKAQAKGKKVAPGVHAHLGLLHFDNGNDAEGQHQFELEKALFPESTKYLDFLLTSRKGA